MSGGDSPLPPETPRPLGLFQACGVELEYMIVNAGSLDTLPVTDQVLHAVAGEWTDEVEQGPLSWSNELVLHVIELKTNGPAPSLAGLADLFQADLGRIEAILAPLGGRLLPGAMHPWMDPHREMHLWPHAYSPAYEAFHRIFDCRGHGWSNLQSLHINLPFAGDAAFGRLHAAVRLVLPILPALAASSPVMDGRLTGILDNRLEVYRHNARAVPSVSGRVIPEPVYTREAYEREILEPMYRDIAPQDPEGILRHEWLNSRGAIARFERGSIEIRVLDVQEGPRADLAVAAATVETVRAQAEETWQDGAAQRAWPVDRLERIFLACVRDADAAIIPDTDYAAAFGYGGPVPCTAGDLWRHILERLRPADRAGEPALGEALELIAGRGCLARRLTEALGPSPDRERLRRVYGDLADCLREGRLYLGSLPR